MGEFADYAVEEAFQNEDWIATYLPDGRLPDPDFDWGVKDLGALEDYTRELSAMLDGAHAGPFEKYRTLKGQAPKVNRASLKATCLKYERAWSMRLGMARTVLAGRRLSDKQAAWMETNWKGGTSNFLHEMGIAGEQIVQNLEKLNAKIQEVINA